MEERKDHDVVVQPLFERLLQLQDRLLAMGSDTQVTDVVRAIAEVANDVLRGHFCVVFPYDQGSDTFIMEQVTPAGAQEALAFQWTTPRLGGTVRTALRQGMFIAEDYERDVERYPFLAGGPGAFKEVAEIHACIGVRLQAGTETVGVLFVNYPEPHHFTEEEKQIARLFASQAAIAIHNAKLHEKMVRTSSRLSSLIDVSQAISTVGRDVELQDVLERTVKAANQVLGADLSVIFAYDERTDRFLMNQLVAAGEGALTFEWEEPRKHGATRRLLNEEALVAVNVQDAPSEWAPLLGSGTFKEHFQVQAVAGIRLQVGTEKVGVLYVNYREPHLFSREECELIQAFANEAAIAIHNMRLFTEREHRIRELTSLSEVQREILGRAFDLNQVFDSIVRRGPELVGAGFSQLLLVEGNELVIRASTSQADIGKRPQIDDCVSGLAVMRRSVVNVGDVTAEKPYCDVYKWYTPGYEMRSELAVPLIVEDEVIGVLNIESPEVGAFTRDHERLMTMSARQVALAIGLAQRYTEQEALRIIQETILGATFDLDETIDLILENMLELLRATHGQLALREGDELVIRGSTGADKGARVRIDDCVSGLAVKEKKPVRVANVHAEEPYKTLYKWFLGKDVGERMRSELVVPLLSEDKVIGVLNVESPQEGAFTQRDEVLLRILAGQAATAIRNAEDRERQKLAAEREKLAKVGELSGDIVHRLSNPMGAIRARIGLMRDKLADLLEGDTYLARSLTDIDLNAERVLAMVRELRERGLEAMGAMEVWPLLTSALSRVEVPETVEVVVKRSDDLPTIRTDAKLENVFYNLLTNAVEAMPNGGKLKVVGSASEDRRWVDVSIRDSGQGIPDHLRDEIFEPYFSTKKGEGHGLGLWWSKAFVEKCGGTINVESEAGKGSSFTVRLMAAI